MSKSSLINYLVQYHSNVFPPFYIKFFIDTLFELIKEELYLGHTIKIRNFGTFYVKDINNKFKGVIKKIKFRSSSTLSSTLNQ